MNKKLLHALSLLPEGKVAGSDRKSSSLLDDLELAEETENVNSPGLNFSFRHVETNVPSDLYKKVSSVTNEYED